MHEGAIVLEILKVAKAAIPKEMGDVSVRAVNLTVGKRMRVTMASEYTKIQKEDHEFL